MRPNRKLPAKWSLWPRLKPRFQRSIANTYSIHQIFLQLKRVRLSHVHGHVLVAYFCSWSTKIQIFHKNPGRSFGRSLLTNRDIYFFGNCKCKKNIEIIRCVANMAMLAVLLRWRLPSRMPSQPRASRSCLLTILFFR